MGKEYGAFRKKALQILLSMVLVTSLVPAESLTAWASEATPSESTAQEAQGQDAQTAEATSQGQQSEEAQPGKGTQVSKEVPLATLTKQEGSSQDTQAEGESASTGTQATDVSAGEAATQSTTTSNRVKASVLLTQGDAVVQGGAVFAVKDGKATLIGWDESAEGNVTVPGAVSYEGSIVKVTAIDIPALTEEELAEEKAMTAEEKAAADAAKPQITHITLPASIQKIGEGGLGDLPALKSVIVSSANQNFTSHDGMLFAKTSNDGEAAETTDGAATETQEATSTPAEGWQLLFIPQAKSGTANIPAEATQVDAQLFKGRNLLISITAESDNETFAARTGMLYTKDMATLVACPVGVRTAVIASKCTAIAENAFAASEDTLRYLAVSGAVETIAENAFPAKVAESAHVLLPGGEENATAEVWKQAGFKNFGTLATSGTTGGTEGSDAEAPAEGTEGEASTGELLAPEDEDPEATPGLVYKLLEDYTLAVAWGGTDAEGATEECPESVTIPAQAQINGAVYPVTAVAAQGFKGAAVKSVSLPASVATIGDSAFEGSSLEDIVLPASVEYVGESAFAACASLQQVVALSTIPSVAATALSGCSGVTVYTPYQAEGNYPWTMGLVASANQVAPYGVFLSQEPISLMVGESASLFGEGDVLAPNDAKLQFGYSAQAVSVSSGESKAAEGEEVSSSTPQVTGKAAGSSDVTVSVALNGTVLASGTRTVDVAPNPDAAEPEDDNQYSEDLPLNNILNPQEDVSAAQINVSVPISAPTVYVSEDGKETLDGAATFSSSSDSVLKVSAVSSTPVRGADGVSGAGQIFGGDAVKVGLQMKKGEDLLTSVSLSDDDVQPFGASFYVPAASESAAGTADMTFSLDLNGASIYQATGETFDAASLLFTVEAVDPDGEGADEIPSFDTASIKVSYDGECGQVYASGVDGSLVDPDATIDALVGYGKTFTIASRDGHQVQGVTFDGEDVTSQLTGTTLVISNVIAGEHVLSVEFVRSECTVMWENQGFVIESKKVPYGTEISPASDFPGSSEPTQSATPGYSAFAFTGWNLDDSFYAKDGEEKVAITGDTTLKAAFEGVTISYTIEYDLNEGSWDGDPAPTTYNIETETFTLPQPVREGYIFMGWTGSNGDVPQKEVTIEQGTIGDKGYAAVWGNLTLISGKDFSSVVDKNTGALSSLSKVRSVTFGTYEEHSNEVSGIEGVPVDDQTRAGSINAYFKKDGEGMYDVYVLTKGPKMYLNASCEGMFAGFEGLEGIEGLGQGSVVDTSKVTDMSCMFGDCQSLEEVDLSGLSTSNVTDMSCMFGDCQSLEEVDLSGLSTSNVTDMGSMFKGCSALKSIAFSSLFDTSSVTGMALMFQDCCSLASLDLGGFNTSRVEDMSGMFLGCSSLTYLDLFSFNTSSLTAAESMFERCSALEKIYVGFSWNVWSGDSAIGDNSACMFTGCTSLAGPCGYGPCGNKVPDDPERSNIFNGRFAFIASDGDPEGYLYPGHPTTAYTVSYNANYGTWPDGENPNPTSYTAESEPFTLIAPEREDYIFLGWTEGTSTTRQAEVTVGPGHGAMKNRAYTAVWGSYELTDGQSLNQAISGTYGSKVKSVTFGTLEQYSDEVSGIDGQNVDVTNAGTVKAYHVEKDGACDVYVLSDGSGMALNADSSYLLNNLSGLTEVRGLGQGSVVDASGVKNASRMLDSCTSLATIDLSALGGALLQDTSSMFRLCGSLEYVDLTAWDTSQVEGMSSMFEGCGSLRTIYVSDLWSTGSVSSGQGMFEGCTSLKGPGLSYDSSKTSFAYAYVGDGGYLTEYPTLVEGDDLAEAMGAEDKAAVRSVTFGAEVAYPDIVKDNVGVDVSSDSSGSIKVYRVEDAGMYDVYVLAHTAKMYLPSRSENMFESFVKLERVEGAPSLIASKVTVMWRMFFECKALESIDVSSWDVSNVWAFENTFGGCESLESIDLGSWDTSSATTTERMFENCHKLKSVDVGAWDVSHVVRMQSMFAFSYALSELDVSGWDTSSVKDMEYMFYKCASLETLDVSSFNTSGVTTAAYMFDGCSSLASLNVATWDSSNMTAMARMFAGCSKLEELNISAWNTSKVENVSGMFNGCSSLKTIVVGPDWDVSQASDASAVEDMMFYGCSKLVNLYNYGPVWGTQPPALEQASLFSTDYAYAAEASAKGQYGYLTYGQPMVVYDVKYVSANDASVVLGTGTATGFYGTTVEQALPSFTGYSKPAGSSVTFSTTTRQTVTFEYSPVSFNITYDLNKGAGSTSPSNAESNPDTYTIEDNAITLADPTREGYTFAGWTGSNGSTPQKEVTIEKGSAGDKAYKANWTANEYTYTIVHKSSGDGHQLASETKTGSFDETYTVDAKSFNGYDSRSSLSVKWDTVGTKTITLEYNPTKYTITYVLDSGASWSGGNPNQTSYTIENAVTIYSEYQGKAIKKVGYGFLGWTGSNGNTPQDTVTISKGSTGNKTYYAKSWGTLTLKSGQHFNELIGSAVGGDGNVRCISFVYGGSGYSGVSGCQYVAVDEGEKGSIRAYYKQNGSLYDVFVLTMNSASQPAVLNQDCAQMFDGFCNMTALNLPSGTLALDASKMRYASKLFYECKKLSTVTGDGLKTSNVEYMDYAFFNCGALTDDALSNLCVSSWGSGGKLSHLENTFGYCTSLTTLDLSKWNTKNVNDMSAMFFGCTGLKSVVGMSSWDTSSVTNMKGLFAACSGLTTLNLQGFLKNGTGANASIEDMFASCTSLTSVNVSGWDTSKVTGMRGVFYRCVNLKEIDLSSWDTSNVTDMRHMFRGEEADSHKLEKIYVSDLWSTASVKLGEGMFSWCQNLTGTVGYGPYIDDHELGDVADRYNHTYAFAPTSAVGSASHGYLTNKDKPLVTYYGAFRLPDGTAYGPNWLIYGIHGETRTVDPYFTEYGNAGCRWSAQSVYFDKDRSSKYVYFQGQYINYTITYTLNGGTVTGNPTSYNKGSSAITLKAPTRTGYTFKGWTGSNGTTPQTSVTIASGSTGNKSYTANWEVTTRTVTVEYKSTSGKTLATSNTYTKNYGASEAIAAVAVTGYNTPSSQTVKFDDNKTVTFTYTPIIYSITYNTDGGANNSANPTSYTIESSTITLKEPTKDGYIPSWNNGGTIAAGSTGNKTFTATWKRNEMDINDFAALFTGGKFEKSGYEGYIYNLYFGRTGDYQDAISYSGTEIMYGDGSSYYSNYCNDSNAQLIAYRKQAWNAPKNSMEGAYVDTYIISKYGTLYLTGELDVSSGNLFGKNYRISSITGLGKGTVLNTSEVTGMKYAFRNIGLSTYITSPALTLTSLDLSGLDTSSVTDMSCMFYDCAGLTSLDLSGLDTSSVTDMSYMFYDCAGLTSLDLSGWEVMSVTSADNMLSGCYALTSLDASGWTLGYTPVLGTNITGTMLQYCRAASPNLSGWDVSRVSNWSSILPSSSSITSPDMSGWKIGGATASDVNDLFKACTSITSPNLSNWDVSGMTSMKQMFHECKSLESLNLSGWDTSNVTNMQGMFRYCESLTSLDLTSFDTSKVTTMKQMFSRCGALTSVDLSSFEVASLSGSSNIEYMFYSDTVLTTIYASSNWTDNAKLAGETPFYGCTSLKGDGASFSKGANTKKWARYDTGYFTYKKKPS